MFYQKDRLGALWMETRFSHANTSPASYTILQQTAGISGSLDTYTGNDVLNFETRTVLRTKRGGNCIARIWTWFKRAIKVRNAFPSSRRTNVIKMYLHITTRGGRVGKTRPRRLVASKPAVVHSWRVNLKLNNSAISGRCQRDATNEATTTKQQEFTQYYIQATQTTLDLVSVARLGIRAEVDIQEEPRHAFLITHSRPSRAMLVAYLDSKPKQRYRQ